MAYCKKCGNELPEGSAFCNKCGASQTAAPEYEESVKTAYCIKCGNEIPSGSAFCNKCGASQSGAPEYVETPEVVLRNNFTFGVNPDICPENERKNEGIFEPVAAFFIAAVLMVLHVTFFGAIWIILAIVFVIIGIASPKKQNYCEFCNHRKAPSAKSCPHCGNRVKPILPLWADILVLIGFAMLYFVLFTNSIQLK